MASCFQNNLGKQVPGHQTDMNCAAAGDEGDGRYGIVEFYIPLSGSDDDHNSTCVIIICKITCHHHQHTNMHSTISSKKQNHIYTECVTQHFKATF